MHFSVLYASCAFSRKSIKIHSLVGNFQLEYRVRQVTLVEILLIDLRLYKFLRLIFNPNKIGLLLKV